MTGELLTVKEYAARQGMTEQAAYKQIRAGKLLTVERQENGKAKKYIFAQEDQDTPPGAAGAPDQSPGPAPDQTGHAAADPRRSSRSRYPLPLRSEPRSGPRKPAAIPEGAAHPPGLCPRWKPPGRAQHGQDTRRAAAGAQDHGHPETKRSAQANGQQLNQLNRNTKPV